MSQAPNNPFELPPGQQPQKNSDGTKTLLWVLGIAGGLFFVVTLVCCGGMMFFGFKAQEFAGEAIKEQFADNPVVVEHLGELESASMDFNATATESGKDPQTAVIVFTVKGSKGEGRILQRTNQQSGAQVIVLETADGEEYEMESLGSFDDLEAELEAEMEEVPMEIDLSDDTEPGPTAVETAPVGSEPVEATTE